MSDILNDPAVLRALVAAHRENPSLRITVAMATTAIPYRAAEAGGHRLAAKTEAGYASVQAFKATFAKRSGFNDVVDLRTYEANFLVRHFFLRCDDSMYVGSYLSHQEGSRSYLMKLKNFDDGLFEVFEEELSHVLDHTVPLPSIERP